MSPSRNACRTSIHGPRHPRRRFAGTGALTGIIAATLLATGCASGPESADPSAASSPDSTPSAMTNDASTAESDARRAEMDERTAAAAEKLDAAYVVGPAAARELGYRIDWQRNTRPSEQSGIRRVELERDSLFVLDGKNFLSRLRLEDGEALWRLPVVEPTREILGINFVPVLNTVYITGGSGVLVLDSDNGSAVGLQKLDKIANNAPVQFGPFLVYGARSGELVWHSFEQDFMAGAYKVARAINLSPVVEGEYVVAVGNNGRVMTLDIESRTQLWDKRMLDTIVAAPTIADDTVFVAGRDQYVYGIDLRSGQLLWSYLTTSPLDTSPVPIDGHVLQWVPGEGLICFESRPRNSYGGRVVWVAEGVSGQVITRHRDRLLVWEQAEQVMTLVDATRGHLIEQIALPQVDSLLCSGVDAGELFVTSNDGRLLRLVPRD